MTSNRQQDIALNSEEAYSLDISLTRVEIKAVHQKGLIHALQSLRQILQSSRQLNIFQMVYRQILVGNFRSVFDTISQMSTRWKYFEVPCGAIHDNPQYEWRGMLLDCSRHFMSKELIIQVLHLMSYHKLNVFHWHLVDDQGWRLEYLQFPLLNEIGSYRKQEDGSVYGGYYTKQDVADIVQVARHLHIRVVPEIELPGHSMAALAAYFQYSCSGSKVEVPHTWGVFEHVYCAGNDDTLNFLTKVFEEALELFGDYVSHVHIGGDECPKSQWRQCDKCKKRVQENNLQVFEQLQSWFITQMVNRLEKFNKTIIGWDEILEGDQLPQSVVVQSWRGYDQLNHALLRGHKSLISPTSHVYFDYPLTVTDIRKVYSFQPIPEGLDQKYHHLILGSEACMWTERAPEHLVLQKIFPRLSAFAFVMWTSPQVKPTFPKFHLLLNSVHLKRLKIMGVDGIGDGLAVRPKMRYDCTVASTMGRHGNYFEEFALDGDAATYYWSNQNVQAGDTFEVIFKSHLPNVDQISVVTGFPMERQRDFLWDGDLQVKFDKQSPWITVGHFHDGQAQGQLQGKSITGVRIVGKRNQNSWLVIRAIDIK
ncbi:hypothetical protein MP228_008025 [Amoeboaphelidium protococcarum]|nr:hypothetical protein MP228_008025 [Amoeboaphelidium protococcarum]